MDGEYIPDDSMTSVSMFLPGCGHIIRISRHCVHVAYFLRLFLTGQMFEADDAPQAPNERKECEWQNVRCCVGSVAVRTVQGGGDVDLLDEDSGLQTGLGKFYILGGNAAGQGKMLTDYIVKTKGVGGSSAASSTRLSCHYWLECSRKCDGVVFQISIADANWFNHTFDMSRSTFLVHEFPTAQRGKICVLPRESWREHGVFFESAPAHLSTLLLRHSEKTMRLERETGSEFFREWLAAISLCKTIDDINKNIHVVHGR